MHSKYEVFRKGVCDLKHNHLIRGAEPRQIFSDTLRTASVCQRKCMMADVWRSTHGCIINLPPSQGRRRMRYYLMGDMSIIPPHHHLPPTSAHLACGYLPWTEAANSYLWHLPIRARAGFLVGAADTWLMRRPPLLITRGGRDYTLDLNNSSHLFETCTALTLRRSGCCWIGKLNVPRSSNIIPSFK